MSKLYFFRHAQASFGSANYDKLSPKGEEQAAILGKYLVDQKIKFDQIFVGPLVRQKHTFSIVAAQYVKHNLELPEPTFIDELKEHSGTEAFKEAMPKLAETHPKFLELKERMEKDPASKRKYIMMGFQFFMQEWANGKLKVEGYESWADFRKNVRIGLNTILENTGKSTVTGAFSSGGTISCITAEALKLQDEERVAMMNYSVRNTSFSTFLFSNEQFNLLSFNEIPHLEKEMITFV